MKPRSLMFTLFGDYIQYYGGEVWVGSVIKLFSEFNISESSVRGAIFRMVQQNLIQVRKVKNKSYYSLTKKGQRNMEDGVRRVYAIRNKEWDGLWRILIYSVPEAKRELRNQIRKELSWIGFGLISNSTWISPNPLEEKVTDIIKIFQLEEYIMLFNATQIVSHDNETIIKKGWDIDAVDKEYHQFNQFCEKKLKEINHKIWSETLSDQECFRERTELVHEYRKFLFQDPGFPLELLPPHWEGVKAREYFWEIHRLLSAGAVRYFDSHFASAPDTHTEPLLDKAINPFAQEHA